MSGSDSPPPGRPDGDDRPRRSILGSTDDEPTIKMRPVEDEPHHRSLTDTGPAAVGRPLGPSTGSPVPGLASPGVGAETGPAGRAGGYDPDLESVHRFDSVNARPYLRRLEQPSPGPNWSAVLKVVAFLLLIVAGIAFVARLRSVDDDDTSAFGGPDGPVANPTVDQLAQATVQILGLDRDGDTLCSGSGTFVSSDGMILTNAHVVARDVVCDYTTLGVAVTLDAGRAPELVYRADVLAVDAEVDLAVVAVAESLDPDVPLPVVFPALALGDSDGLAIGDDLRIFGYPEIGGETITFTNGSVSGFTAQAGIGDRALIKTDATIAGGNSGGAAVDREGRLIGIPTKARASESGPAIDCRPLADTNNDGEVDSSDNCVPIGGFLNGIRPINLARDVIDRARESPNQPLGEPRPLVEVDPATVAMSRPRFSLGEANNAPTEIVDTATGGVTELCLFVDWAGIPDGVEWDGIWWYDQELVNEYSLVEQIWGFGAQGSNFWMCAIDDENGLDAGLYELGFFLNGDLIFAEGIVLTDEAAPLYPTMWVNETEADVCGLAINPAGSGPVGLNELEPGLVLAPGETATIELPPGPVVVEASDCDGRPLADSAGTIDIEPDRTYTIGLPGSTPAE